MVLPSGVTIEFGTTYDIITIDLGIAHDLDEIERSGDVISVISITGELDIRLNEKDEPAIEIDKIIRVVTKPLKFTKFFITNIAQAGKEAILYIGKEASFESYPQRTGTVGILDAADVRINPAKEDGYLKSLADDALTSLIAVSTGLDETSPQSITLDSKGKRLLELYGKASASTNFRLDCSPDNGYWITDYKIYSAVTEAKDTRWNGFRYVRLRSDAAGVAGDTVDLVLSAK